MLIARLIFLQQTLKTSSFSLAERFLTQHKPQKESCMGGKRVSDVSRRAAYRDSHLLSRFYMAGVNGIIFEKGTLFPPILLFSPAYRSLRI
jgi:hypothetical protein